MKYEIMLRILFDLLCKKSVTARYLSSKYDVCIRSIYRYIECLESAGVPLYTERGKEGGIKIVDSYKLPSTFMTVKEFENVISALDAINDGVPDKTLESAIAKLKAVVKNEHSGFNIKSGNLVIDAGPWGDTVGYKLKLKIIQTCIEENKLLLIEYCDRNGEKTQRIIEPHIIVFKQGLWYVYAYCRLREEFRFFKTGRIEKAEIQKETFTRRDVSKSDLPLDFWQNAVETINVEFEVSKDVLADVEEWIGVENVTKVNDKYLARANLPNDGGLVSKIMSYGDGVKVIAPKELKKNIKSIAEKIIQNLK